MTIPRAILRPGGCRPAPGGGGHRHHRAVGGAGLPRAAEVRVVAERRPAHGVDPRGPAVALATPGVLLPPPPANAQCPVPIVVFGPF